MERYHIYKLGIAILFYAVYCRRPMLVNGLEVDDVIGTVNNKSSTPVKLPGDDYYVYYQGVEGRPGVDFPVYSRIPRTGFSCKEVESGYYADLETNCQVFHICNEGIKVSFLCPNGTIFQQSDLICDWWFKVNCTNSPNLYEESAEQLRESHIRRKASRRVLNRGQVTFRAREQFDHKQFSDRKMDVQDDGKLAARGGRKFTYTNEKSSTSRPQKNTFSYHETGSSEEMQIPQETASFFKSNYNNIQTTKKNPYPNHRETYSDIQNPKNYYTNIPSYPSTPSQPPQQSTINNGRPFVVSTPKVGVYTTQRTTFKYSPTVPTTAKSTTKSAPITAIYGKTTFGTRTNSKSYNSTTKAQSTPKIYSNVETFTSPPSISNGKSTVSRKPKSKTSFTIGLNSLQGAVPIKTQTDGPRNKPTTTSSSTKKDVIKINLSSDGRAKVVKNKGRAYEPDNSKTTRISLSSDVAPPLLSIENEIPAKPSTNRPTTGFFVTKSNSFRPAEFITSSFNSGSITGSKNTYIPTTRPPVYTTFPPTTYTEYVSNTFGFVKPTGVPKPKPFELPSSSTERSSTGNYVSFTEPPDLLDFVNPTLLPNYQISSASPFTNVPPTLPTSYQTYTTPRSEYTLQPTYPTVYNSAHAFTTAQPLPQNVHSMLDTLKEIANVRFAKQEDFENSRPGLIVPPSVGPQTLHTLAVYFANALDSLVPEENATESQTEVGGTSTVNENLVINSLLSRKTVDKYHELFMETETPEEDVEAGGEETVDDEDNDLNSDHSSNAVQSPRVRQLAKVFTQALSSYLDDPDMFRKVLQQIRPTEPPLLNTLPTESPDEDELLNFSDADLKPDSPRLPTPAPANPTWGYILAFNTTDFKTNNIDNTLGDENLQSADSQSFITGYNDVAVNRVNKALKDNALTSNESGKGFDVPHAKGFGVTSEGVDKGFPTNHWTSSPDVAKLWQTTLYVNPFSINEKFENTEATSAAVSTSSEDFEDLNAQKLEPESDSSSDLSEFVTESVVDYELHALPKLELNSTQVHGILINFMNSTNSEDSTKLQRILSKLNTTEDEFLSKMKQIEENPLTRRLILLLISECGANKTLETKASAVRDIIHLATSNESIQSSSTNWESVALKSNLSVASTPSAFTKLVDPQLKDEDQDARALQLLNSLYSIASKYGK